MQCLPHSPSLCHNPAAVDHQGAPPLSDPHVLHTPLDLRNLCATRFESKHTAICSFVLNTKFVWGSIFHLDIHG
jgi:hypothetical protein